MKNLKKSRAFTLFEIIVSIIVLGIIAATFPIILQNTVKTAKTVTKEESVLNELSLLKMILTYEFDENNTKEDNFYKDLNASGGDSELLINSYGKYTGIARKGKAQIDNNFFRQGSELNVSKIGIDKDENKSDVLTYDDIDDFNDYNQTRNNVTFFVKVYYMNDETNYNDENITFDKSFDDKKNATNIKVIQISSDNGVVLYYPTSNIGGSKFLSLEEISR